MKLLLLLTCAVAFALGEDYYEEELADVLEPKFENENQLSGMSNEDSEDLLRDDDAEASDEDAEELLEKSINWGGRRRRRSKYRLGKYTLCAAEGSTCTCNGNVRFGAKGKWKIKHSVKNSIRCTTNVFGDPIKFTSKTCECAGIYKKGTCSPHQNEVNLGIETIKASYIAYDRNKDWKPKKNLKFIGGWEIKKVYTGNYGGTWLAFLAQNQKRNGDCMIAFRGTYTGKGQWKETNLKYEVHEVHGDNVQMHTGFFHIAQAATKKIRQDMGSRVRHYYEGQCHESCRNGYKTVGHKWHGCCKNWKCFGKAPKCEKFTNHYGMCQGKKIIVTGHSLGGAMAQIFTWALLKGRFGLKKRSRNDVQTYTYAQPQTFMSESHLFGTIKTEGCPSEILGNSRNHRFVLTTKDGKKDFFTGQLQTYSNLALPGIRGWIKNFNPVYCANAIQVQVGGDWNKCGSKYKDYKSNPKCPGVGIKYWKHQDRLWPNGGATGNDGSRIMDNMLGFMSPNLVKIVAGIKDQALHSETSYMAAVDANGYNTMCRVRD